MSMGAPTADWATKLLRSNKQHLGVLVDTLHVGIDTAMQCDMGTDHMDIDTLPGPSPLQQVKLLKKSVRY